MGSLWLLYTFYSGSYWRSREIYWWRTLGNGSNGDYTGIVIFVSHLPGNPESIEEEKSQRNSLWFESYAQSTLSFEKFETEMGKDAVRKLEKMIAKGYIRNIQIDREENYILITAPNRRVNEKIYITVTCPSCGAKNQIIKGRLCNCEYCGQRLTSWQQMRIITQGAACFPAAPMLDCHLLSWLNRCIRNRTVAW